jgi:hypothetical protein
MTALEVLLPFTNDIANVFSSSGIKKLKKLYKENPTTKAENISKLLIDLISLTGILLTTVRTTKKHGTKVGLIKGVMELMIAFVIIPLLDIPSIMNKMCYKKCYPLQKIIVGILIIGMIIGIEFLFDKYIIKHKILNKKPYEKN